jgi:GNAT superfamily N-acetyltransferase
MLSVTQIHDLPADALAPLVAESEREGFRFVRRLQDDWLAGANRFSQPGEALFGVFEGDRLLAVGGISRESADCGRLRRFYVTLRARRQGLGRLLGRHLLAFAARNFSRVVLRTDTEDADHFYRSLGFTRVTTGAGFTHVFEVPNARTAPPPPVA